MSKGDKIEGLEKKGITALKALDKTIPNSFLNEDSEEEKNKDDKNEEKEKESTPENTPEKEEESTKFRDAEIERRKEAINENPEKAEGRALGNEDKMENADSIIKNQDKTTLEETIEKGEANNKKGGWADRIKDELKMDIPEDSSFNSPPDKAETVTLLANQPLQNEFSFIATREIQMGNNTTEKFSLPEMTKEQEDSFHNLAKDERNENSRDFYDLEKEIEYKDDMDMEIGDLDGGDGDGGDGGGDGGGE